MTDTLRIHLLGPFELSLNGNASAQWPSQQTQTVAKLLFTNRGRVVTSDRLIDILWPDEPIDLARSRLHVRISQLRNILGENKSLLRTVHGGYLFQPDETCWLDVDEFESLISQGARHQEKGQQIKAIAAFEEARQFYRGDFLAEDLYADWTYNQREALHESFIGLLIELSECYAQQGRYRLAITRARQALVQDHLRETIYVRLMLYHYYAGERDQALRAYDRCQEILKKELGVGPMSSTLEIYAQIKAGKLWKDTDTLRYPPPIYEGRLFEVPYALTEIPFIGREREFAWLVSQWNDSSKRMILLEGEAGVGKSRLANSFVEYLHSANVRLLKVQLSPLDHRPTTTIVSALSDLLTESTLEKLSLPTLSALAILLPEIRDRVNTLPELPALSQTGEHQRLIQALSALAAVYASEAILLFVDDAQRLGPAAVDLLVQLSTSIRVLLIFRSEDTPPDHPARKVLGATLLKLTPLSLQATRDLIQRLSGSERPDLANQLHSQSDGVPLFVVTLLQHMFETGQLFVNSDNAWETTSQEKQTLPATLRETVEARLNHLNPVQRRVLDFAAVLGGKFNFNLLEASTRQSEESLLATIDDLVNAGLVVEPRSLGKPEFMLSHDRYIEVAYETLPVIRRKMMHLQVAQAIEALYARQIENHYPELADHYYNAEQPEKAAQYAGLAGEQAITRFASDEALQYLDMALSLTGDDQTLQLTKLRLDREAINNLLGKRNAQAEDLIALETSLSHLPPEHQAEIYLRRAGYEWILGNDEKAKQALEKAINIARTCEAKEIEARALVLAGRAATDLTQANKDLYQARQIASEIGAAALEGEIIRYLGNVAYWQNQFPECRDLFMQALDVHRKVGDLRGELSALNNLGMVSVLLSDLPVARAHYRQAEEICQRIGDRLAEGVIANNLGRLTSELGDFSEGRTLLEKALIIRDEIQNEEGLALVHKDLGDLFHRTSQFELALSHFNEALNINTKIKHKEQTYETLISLAALYRDFGDNQQALAFLDQATEIPVSTDSQQNIKRLLNACLLNTINGDPSDTLQMGKEALSLSEELPLLHAVALKNVGHTLLALDRLQEAHEHFQQAYTQYITNHQAHLALEPLAGLAKAAFLQENLRQASSFIETITEAIAEGPIEGPDRTLWIYLVCYQVLSASEDERAFDVIESANHLLLQRAGAITDPGLRQSYLTGVSENKEISAIWNILINTD